MIKAPVKSGGQDFEICPEGTLQSVITNVYDVGIHEKKAMDGQPKQEHQLIICFEVNKLINSGQYAGKRFVLSNTYNLSMSKKSNLRKLVELFVGEISDDEAADFDLETLRGLNCAVTVIHREFNGKMYANIKAIAPLMDGIQAMTPELSPDNIPEWIKKKADSQIIKSDIGSSDINSPGLPPLGNLSKVEKFNAVSAFITAHPEFRNEFQSEFVKYGSLGKVPEEKMTEWYFEYC